MPLFDPRDIGREQVYGQPQPTKFMGSFPHSRYTSAEIEALGTQGATSQISPATGRLRGLVGPTNYPQSGVELPPTRGPIDVATPQQPMLTGDDGSIQTPEALQRFLYWLQSPSGPRGASMQSAEDRFGSMLRGIREVLPQQQQQPRTIQTTDPGAGYGMSPSGPTAQMPPARTPKPMSPFYEGPRPTIGVTRETRSPIAPGPSRRAMVQEARDYARSPSNPNWRPPGG